MIDCNDFLHNAPLWSLLHMKKLLHDKNATQEELTKAKCEYMYWLKDCGLCGVCRTSNYFVSKPPFCTQCWENRVVDASPFLAYQKNILPIYMKTYNDKYPIGAKYDSMELEKHNVKKLPKLLQIS